MKFYRSFFLLNMVVAKLLCEGFFLAAEKFVDQGVEAW